MGLILLLVGLIIIIIVYITLTDISVYFPNVEKEILENKKITEIEGKIDILSNSVDEVLHIVNQPVEKPSSFSQQLEQVTDIESAIALEQAKDEHLEIRDAFNNGESISSIAKRFNRGKGEIELILNLKK